MNQLPGPRGELSEWLLAALVQPVHALDVPGPRSVEDPLADEDLHLCLYLCYELHYRGLPGVDDRWEWEPTLLALRRVLETSFEYGLLESLPPADRTVSPGEVDLALRAIAERGGPALSAYARSRATLEHLKEFLVHRSAYQLKEADPHSWAIPRLFGPPKAALIEIQADEYGGGRRDWIHPELFARAMHAVGLDRTYRAHLDLIPAPPLAPRKLMSLFGLHRRWARATVR